MSSADDTNRRSPTQEMLQALQKVRGWEAGDSSATLRPMRHQIVRDLVELGLLRCVGMQPFGPMATPLKDGSLCLTAKGRKLVDTSTEGEIDESD